MKRIGITGPTGAGKTTALNVLAGLGVHRIDCDALYHKLLAESHGLCTALTTRFGEGILIDGAIDRKRLGAVVFSDPAALEALNTITHRFVREEVFRLCAAAEQIGAPGVAIDAIALIESGLGAQCHAVVGILAPAEVRIRRIMAREGISEAYARKRVEAQKRDDYFRAHCQFILENSGEDTAEDFQRRSAELFTQILNQSH